MLSDRPRLFGSGGGGEEKGSHAPYLHIPANRAQTEAGYKCCVQLFGFNFPITQQSWNFPFYF